MSSPPRIILISGWAHDSSAMEAVGRGLENTADASSVSPGDLWSAKPKTGAASSYTQSLAKMIDKNGGPVFIAGWSLGGMIALETAACRPSLVAGLILISTTPKFCSGPGWTAGTPAGILRAMERKLKRDPGAVFEDFLLNTARPLAENKENLSLKIEKACAMNPLELSAGLEYLSETDLRNETKKINVPALVIHGKLDAIVPVEAGMALKNLLPVSEIRVYDNYGHGLPWQNPAAIAENIKVFLKKCRNLNTRQFPQ